mmetsp:Transcript_11420/g.21632  ORF Transcript_11420/g.21632 Transcript_11420/m.21632 type:complete len:192 (-) Transcript_11420:2634-3209(-)
MITIYHNILYHICKTCIVIVCNLRVDFDVEANAPPHEPPLVTATPITMPVNYASASLPTPIQVINDNAIHQQHVATHGQLHLQSQQHQPLQPQNLSEQQQQQQQQPPLGRHPTNIPLCPHCSATNVATRTSTFPSFETWFLAIGLFFVFWPVCWMPLVVDSAKKTEHICTNCGVVVGTVKPMSDCCVKSRG